MVLYIAGMERTVKPNITTYKNFRIFLQNELIDRCKKKAAYSLRAFSRSLKINHAASSQILSGKRKLTKKMMMRLSLNYFIFQNGTIWLL